LSQLVLVRRLMIPVPPTPAALLTSRLPQSSAATASQVLKAPKLNVQIAGDKHEPYTLTSVSDNRPQTVDSQIPSLILDPRCILGAVGIVYRCQPELIVKFSLSTKMARNQLTHEASVYKHLTKQPHHANVPTFYGLFRCSTGLAMVISDEGRPLSSFQSLSTKQSDALLKSLVNVHRTGVLHGDFVPRNVVSKGEDPVIIDFSHAQLNHNCPGRLLCEELVRAEKLLTHVPDDRCIVGVKGILAADTGRPHTSSQYVRKHASGWKTWGNYRSTLSSNLATIAVLAVICVLLNDALWRF